MGFIFVPMGSHVHPNIGVAPETLAADLAKMRVLGKDVALLHLHDVANPIVHFFNFFPGILRRIVRIRNLCSDTFSSSIRFLEP